MAVKVGINGFGRIGRNVLRAALGNKEIDFAAVNDLTSPATLAHLLKYDSILGNLKNEITAGEDVSAVDGKKIKVWAERDPAKLPWAEVGAQIVVESTGHFTDGTKAKAHLGARERQIWAARRTKTRGSLCRRLARESRVRRRAGLCGPPNPKMTRRGAPSARSDARC